MLSNFVINQQKFVLFVDDVGLQRHSETLFRALLKQQGQNEIQVFPEFLDIDFGSNPAESFPEPVNISKATNILLQPLAQLLLALQPRAVFHLIDRLKKDSNTKQIFLWASTCNISNSFVIPFVEYMADTIVTLNDAKHLSIISRKSGGLVTNKYYQYQIGNGEFAVKEVKRTLQKVAEATPNPEALGTFKINLEEEEMVARNALKLPYERTSDAPKEGDIVYTPDADDDFDDEDPDEDLYI